MKRSLRGSNMILKKEETTFVVCLVHVCCCLESASVYLVVLCTFRFISVSDAFSLGCIHILAWNSLYTKKSQSQVITIYWAYTQLILGTLAQINFKSCLFCQIIILSPSPCYHHVAMITSTLLCQLSDLTSVAVI